MKRLRCKIFGHTYMVVAHTCFEVRHKDGWSSRYIVKPIFECQRCRQCQIVYPSKVERAEAALSKESRQPGSFSVASKWRATE